MPDTSVPVHGHCDDRFRAVREIFEEGFAAGRELGAAVALCLDGELVVDLWGGHVDRERTRPWQRDTLVNTYSTTKGMTALCAHQLVERGLLDVDAPVADYWPEFAAAGKDQIPVRWLLSHRAGLPAVRKPLPRDAFADWSLMTNALAETEPWWEPGTRHGYHALSFGFLVGEVIRRAGGKSVGTWFRDHVAGPLEADFHIGLAPEHDARTSLLYGALAPPRLPEGSPSLPGPLAAFLRDMNDPSTMTGAAFNNPPRGAAAVNTRLWRGAEIPAANGHGTARALARIYGALARGGALGGVRLLETESIARATEEQSFGPDAVLGEMPMRYGLGFMLRHDLVPLSPSPRGFGHPGAGGSIGMADPDARLGFGFTMNEMKLGLAGGPSGFAMLQAFYDAL
jgi:CubicO group peptidase (beta-lactamase class C family)